MIKRKFVEGLVITKRTTQGKPIRGSCPICDIEFSTEAFEDDPSYEHEQKLKEVFNMHLAEHIKQG